MVALARCYEHAEAAAIAKEMAESPPTSEVFYFQAGCGYALAAGCVPGDAALALRYTSAAIACLRQAKKTGWNDVESLEIDPDLEPIRKSPQFRELLAEFKQTVASPQRSVGDGEDTAGLASHEAPAKSAVPPGDARAFF